MASKLNTLPKYVASTTLTDPEWANSRVIEGDVADAVRDLKEREGGELQVHGSGQLVRFLLEHDLVDVLRLKIHPLVLGHGKKLFDDAIIAAAFTLTDSIVTPSGVIIANYKRAGDVKTGRVGAE